MVSNLSEAKPAREELLTTGDSCAHARALLAARPWSAPAATGARIQPPHSVLQCTHALGPLAVAASAGWPSEAFLLTAPSASLGRSSGSVTSCYWRRAAAWRRQPKVQRMSTCQRETASRVATILKAPRGRRRAAGGRPRPGGPWRRRRIARWRTAPGGGTAPAPPACSRTRTCRNRLWPCQILTLRISDDVVVPRQRNNMPAYAHRRPKDTESGVLRQF